MERGMAFLLPRGCRAALRRLRIVAAPNPQGPQPGDYQSAYWLACI